MFDTILTPPAALRNAEHSTRKHDSTVDGDVLYVVNNSAVSNKLLLPLLIRSYLV